MMSFRSFYYLNENKCTDSIEFKKWFKDSKVVNKNGNPLICYKAMYPYDEEGNLIKSIQRTTDFPDFENNQIILNTGIIIAGFFTDSTDVSNKFGHRGYATYPVYLSFQNPYIIDAKGEFSGKFQFKETGKPFRDAIKSGNYDSVIIKNTKDEGNVFVALKPTQIKSALCNSKFDLNNPNINESGKIDIRSFAS